jgi:methionine synthase I (cobalamin-dependent)/5,10-methylenetetrahydrofolate reductase
MDFLDELETRVLPGDGAMGTLLMEANIPPDRCFDELCISEPDLVRSVHERYIAAGARVIETNSFGANAARLDKFGLANRVNEINWSAAQLARDCARGHDVYVAGSVGPLGLTSEQALESIDRKQVFQEQIGALLDGGAQLIFFETFSDLEELLLALDVKLSLHHCPAICSLTCSEDGRLRDGTPLEDAFTRLRDAGAEVTGVNCVTGPHAMVRIFQRLPAGELLSAYPNAGYPRYHDGRYLYGLSPAYFAENSVALAREGARLIGGCCGIGPQHIAEMAKALREVEPVKVKVPAPRRIEPVVAPEPSAPPEETSILDLIARGRTAIVTELDPPKTLDLQKFFQGARALTDAGSDVITLADNSLAILRVSNLALGAMLKQQGITPLLHVSCRDRNLLGLQSDLMGMAALGIRHLLPLTGDPAKVGDHPGASSVYDVNSIELITMIRRMNEGFNHNGKEIKAAPHFVPGCTFNPNARNLDAQIARLERKLAAGAQYVMTQPVFEPGLVAQMADCLRHLDVPIFTGVWPLLNGRQAEFLHHEVPGIIIPDEVRRAMAGLEGPEGRARGIEIAKEICRAATDHFPGVYLITPFLAYSTTVELAQFVRGRG